jgi:hypothetical protein
MRVYDESTSRRARVRVHVNWSRELTFSERQINYIKDNVPAKRGAYCVYAKPHSFPYASPQQTLRRWSGVVYIGSGWLSERLSRHLSLKENDVLEGYLDSYELAYRYALIANDLEEDWPRIVEASLLYKYGTLPPANRRKETIPELGLHILNRHESDNFNILM